VPASNDSKRSKIDALREEGALNPAPEKVRDSKFRQGDFFDPRDVVQVKYEMLRRVQREGETVRQSAAAFGLSRPSFYQAQAAFQEGGLPALLPQKRGPKHAHKLTVDVLAFLRQARHDDPSVRPAALASRDKAQYGITVHPRSIERALTRRQKKPR
jgi:transposase